MENVLQPGICAHSLKGRWGFIVLRLVALTLLLAGLLPAGAVRGQPAAQSVGKTQYLPLLFNSPNSLVSQIVKTSLTLPRPLQQAVNSWCTWGWCTITPRLYHEPRSDGSALLGWNDSEGNGHISSLTADRRLGETWNYPARTVRGLVAHDDGSCAALLSDTGGRMWLVKLNANGSQAWATDIKDALTHFDAGIGDSRLAYGNGMYGAYFAVHGDSGWVEGHNGDQLTYVDANGRVQSGGWGWGCSHSMAALIDFHPALAKFMPVCSSDCYAKKALLIKDNLSVYTCDGNCGGLVSAQLGQTAQTNNGWKMIFNALGTSNVIGKGIGLATIQADFSSSYVWLTNTNGATEREAVIARLGSSLDRDLFLVGWKTTDNGVYHLELINGSGAVVMPLENVSAAGIRWGDRDDSLRTRPDGNVSWVQGAPGSTTLNYYLFLSGSYLK